MINHISKYNKFAQETTETKYHWLGKVIHLDLCQKFNFISSNKSYMHN